MNALTRRRSLGGIATGLIAGGLSGLFGVGGGILIVPGLVLLLRMDRRRAHATSLAAILPIATAGVGGYALSELVDWRAGAFLAAGSVVGVLIGTEALQRLPERVLRWSFSGVLLLAAGGLAVQGHAVAGRDPLTAWTAALLLGVGLAAGVLAGVLGVGGGVVTVPALVLLLAVPDAVAKGTSLAVILPTAALGTARNVRYGNVDVAVAAWAGVAGAAAAFAAARLAVGLSPRLSSALFAVLLVAVAARTALAGRRPAASRPSATDVDAPNP